MTLRGMIRISALGAILLVAITVASAVAHGQELSVTIDPKPDTLVVPKPGTPVVFGIDTTVVTQANLPVTAPARSYCVLARVVHDPRVGELVLVDQIASRASAFDPSCTIGIPLMVRPDCQLSTAEDRNRPAILFCDIPPKVFMLSKRDGERSAQ